MAKSEMQTATSANKLEHLRPYSGWVRRAIVREHCETLKTRIAVDEEYWLGLRHPAEVEAVGRSLLGTTNPNFRALEEGKQNQVWREFRAYIRQAEGFYRGARVLPWKCSPLNYYYSFMNLAKAVAVARGVLPPCPDEGSRRLQHGLSARVPGTSDIWRLTVQGRDGIFGMLYNESVGMEIPNHIELDARRLLGYVSDIGWQLGKSGNEDLRAWFLCKWVILRDDARYWDVIGIPCLLPVDQLGPAFAQTYQEVPAEAGRQLGYTTLGLHANQAICYRFFERREPLTFDGSGSIRGSHLDRLLKEAIPNSVFACLTDADHHFALGLFYSAPAGPIPMNELMASYAIMYFLSSLVRYHPDYMDKIGESSDAWLIESFAKSSPLTLLRHLSSMVLGYTLIIDTA